MKVQTNETNIYYSLISIEKNNLTQLKYRQIKNRLKLLLTTDKIIVGNLCYKKGARWFIHYSLVDLFQAERIHDKSKVRAIKYKTEITINLDSNYDTKFYTYLGEKIKQVLKHSKTIYAIETSPTNENRYHLHLGTTAQQYRILQKLKEIEVATGLIIIENKNTNIAPIRNLTRFVNYIAKQNQNLVNELKDK